MSRLFYHVMQDNVGNLLFNVSGTIRLAGTGTLATIYGDEALTVPIANPMTNHPSFGSFKCFLGVGDYDFYMAKSGYTFETLTGVQGSGTMADQNANAVAITGGQAQFTGTLGVTGDTTLTGKLGVQGAPSAFNALRVFYLKGSTNGLQIQPSDSDVAAGSALSFTNVAQTAVGSITTTASATAYNTSSDVRLKFDVEDLLGALTILRQLRPITHLWKADGSRGYSFLAHEVAEVVDGVVTGEANATNDDGTIRPQQIDLSKLVPWLVAGLKELDARLTALERALA